jgi:uncharacterized protein YheU (UPF0270 family)
MLGHVKVLVHVRHEFSMLIPFEQIEADTLTRLIEDFVTRDGTDNGDETPLHTRIERVRHALDKKQAVIVFDVESQQCQLCLKRDVPKEWLADLEMLSAQDSAE